MKAVSQRLRRGTAEPKVEKKRVKKSTHPFHKERFMNLKKNDE